ncbi:MAG: transposase [Cyanobacteria bacterium J06635_1]
MDFEVYRRYETVTDWESFVVKHFPEQQIPKNAQARAKLHRQLDPTLMSDPEFALLHQLFWTKFEMGKVLIDQAIERGLPFQTVLFDSWYLSAEFVTHLKASQKDWVSLLKVNRNLEAYSIRLRDADGQRIQFTDPHIKVENLVPLIPKTAFRPVELENHTYWCFTLCVRIPGLGKVRLVISFEPSDLSGTYAVFVTNRTDWTAKQILSKYLQRWPIETFYRDGKQYLGLDEYRMRTAEAIETHWCLVFVAYSILHLGCLPPPPKKVRANRRNPAKPLGRSVDNRGKR